MAWCETKQHSHVRPLGLRPALVRAPTEGLDPSETQFKTKNHLCILVSKTYPRLFWSKNSSSHRLASAGRVCSGDQWSDAHPRHGPIHVSAHRSFATRLSTRLLVRSLCRLRTASSTRAMMPHWSGNASARTHPVVPRARP